MAARSPDDGESDGTAGAGSWPRPRREREGHALPITIGGAETRPLKTSEGVARDIVNDIVNRGLTTGDRLPPEAVMLEEYAVSRESLREGLRLLEVQGLITIRRGPGGGPVVSHLDPGNLGRTSALYFHLAGGTYAELFDAWVEAESWLAEMAARNPDREMARAEMAPYSGSIEDHDDQSVAEFVVEHTHFHAAVAALVGNRVMELLLQTVGRVVTHHVVMTGDPRAVKVALIEDHAEIARAIAAGQPQKARRAMEEHLSRLAEIYRKQIGPQIDDFIEWR